MKTKRIIAIIIALLATVSVVLAQNNCKLDPEAEKFAGTWEWREGNNSFTFILKFNRVNFAFKDEEPKITEMIVGYHKFIKDGIVVEDSTPFKNTEINIDKKEIKCTLFAFTEDKDKNILVGFLTHLSKNKGTKCRIKYIDFNHIKLVKVFNTSGVKISTAEHPYDSSISLPQNIILTRVK